MGWNIKSNGTCGWKKSVEFWSFLKIFRNDLSFLPHAAWVWLFIETCAGLGFLVRLTTAGVEERVLCTATAHSQGQIMLARLLCWAHQQPTARPIRAERKLHNNDCSTLPEDSAHTTTIPTTLFIVSSGANRWGVVDKKSAPSNTHKHCMHLVILSVIYGIACTAIMQSTVASLR